MLTPLSASADVEARSSQLLPAPSDWDPFLQRYNPQVGVAGDNCGQHNFSGHQRKTKKISHVADKLLDSTPWQTLKDQKLAKSISSNAPVDGSRSSINSGVSAFTSAEQQELLSSRNRDDKYTQRLLSLEKKSPISSYSPTGTSSAKKFEVFPYLFGTLCGKSIFLRKISCHYSISLFF